MKARREADFVVLYQLEGNAWIIVGGTDNAVVCGVELKLDKIADFSLSHFWDEGVGSLYSCSQTFFYFCILESERSITNLCDTYCPGDWYSARG